MRISIQCRPGIPEDVTIAPDAFSCDAGPDSIIEVDGHEYAAHVWVALAFAAERVPAVKVFEDKNGEGRYTPVGENGEPLAQSEGYAGGAAAARQAAAKMFPFARLEDRDG